MTLAALILAAVAVGLVATLILLPRGPLVAAVVRAVEEDRRRRAKAWQLRRPQEALRSGLGDPGEPGDPGEGGGAGSHDDEGVFTVEDLQREREQFVRGGRHDAGRHAHHGDAGRRSAPSVAGPTDLLLPTVRIPARTSGDE